VTTAPTTDLRPLASAISLRFRRRRMARFLREMRVTPETRVLDVGGTPECWRLLERPPKVTLLNSTSDLERWSAPETQVAGDGRLLPFRDGAFDIVFSNSVIEHLGTREDQERFALEAARVGRAYWIQTPNRWFPLEQHLLTPFIHWLPRPWQRRLAPRLSLSNSLLSVGASRQKYYISHFLNDIRLIGPRELSRLFPGAKIIRERFLGLSKSLTAVRRAES
jgi:hypothetical protein